MNTPPLPHNEEYEQLSTIKDRFEWLLTKAVNGHGMPEDLDLKNRKYQCENCGQKFNSKLPLLDAVCPLGHINVFLL